MSSHRFHHEYSLMRAGGSTQLVDILSNDIKGCLKAQCVIGSRQIFINSLGNTNNIDTFLREFIGYTQGVITTDGYNYIKTQFFYIG